MVLCGGAPGLDIPGLDIPGLDIPGLNIMAVYAGYIHFIDGFSRFNSFQSGTCLKMRLA